MEIITTPPAPGAVATPAPLGAPPPPPPPPGAPVGPEGPPEAGEDAVKDGEEEKELEDEPEDDDDEPEMSEKEDLGKFHFRWLKYSIIEIQNRHKYN